MSEVTVAYKFSAPIGDAQFAPWQGAELAIVETPPEGADLVEFAASQYAMIKTLVLNELGIATILENDKVLPVIESSNIPQRNSNKSSHKKSGGDTVGGRPTVMIDGTEYVDYRESAEKTKNARFPDFKTVQGDRPVWLLDKDGNKTDFALQVEEAKV